MFLGIWVDDEKELFNDNFMESSTWIVVKTSQDEMIGCSRLIEDTDAEIFGYLGWYEHKIFGIYLGFLEFMRFMGFMGLRGFMGFIWDLWDFFSIGFIWDSWCFFSA